MKTFKGRDQEELARMAAGALATVLRQTKRPAFSVVLAGGSTPQLMHSLLASEPYRRMIPWETLHVFFGDERCVPPDHKESNYRAAKESLLSKVPIPERQIHRVRGEDPPEQAAAAYEAGIRAYFAGKTPAFDWVYLGMGDDGHTASLFPGTPALQEKERLVVANRSPAGVPERVTMTFPLLNQAKTVCLVVAGEKKAAPLARVVKEGPASGLPAALLKPSSGDLRLFCDQAAGPLL